MYISPIRSISFQSLKYHTDGKIKLFDKFYHSVNDDNTPALLTSINKVNQCVFETKFYDDEEEKLAAHACSEFVPSCSYIHINTMSTEEDKRGLGLGAGLHLLNIVEMMENPDIKEINLMSTANAMPFHMKFGFYPCGDYYRELKSNIEIISLEDDLQLKCYADAAKRLLLSRKREEDKTKMANRLLFEFTRAALSMHKDMEGYYTLFMPMVLTKENVLRNSNFYNNLFKKYDIDYKIEGSK